ncbi:hypothetical protein AB0J38_17440 [Streptomyces sp. NPDC050095]|uniref:hypothetical protein n=1 Tax=unclassified Streptomyces TaxID=2593676 RepID=UPI0034331134
MPEIISDLDARKIASEWHGGQATALYSLTSCGAILPGLVGEIDRELWFCLLDGDVTDDDRDGARQLGKLRDYAQHHGERGPVDGWSELNW